VIFHQVQNIPSARHRCIL